MNRNTRRARRPRQRAAGAGQIAQLKRSLHGHENRLSWMAPPQINLRPWNNCVVQFGIPNAGTETFYSPGSIINRLVTQLGISSQTQANVNIKIHRIDAYTMPTGGATDRPAISMDVSSLVPILSDLETQTDEVIYPILKKLSDQGNLSEAAKVSYTWPLHMQDIPLPYGATFSVAAVAGNQDNTCVRIHLSWASTAQAVPQ